MDLKDLTLTQLDSLFSEKLAAFQALKAKTAPTVADIEGAKTLAAELTTIREAQAAFASLDSLEQSFAEKTEDKVEDKPADKAAEPEVPADVKGGSGKAVPDETVAVEQQVEVPGPGETVDGEGNAEKVEARQSAVEALAAKQTGLPDVPTHRTQGGRIAIKAAPDTLFSAGTTIDMLQVAEAVGAKATSFPVPQGDGQTTDLRPFPTASFQMDFPKELIVDERDGDVAFDEAIRLATDESTLPGGSLVASGGWCAPSEQVYDLTQDATTDGMLSLPEIGVKRGGLKWPISPNFAAFYANPGFKQTESQAISGTSKTCVEVDCPSFDEKRLSVEGVCIKVPILTNVGYPEYVRNFIDGTMVAHQHWMNAAFMADIVGYSTSARVIAGLGATTTDTLNGLELLAEETRQKYRLSLNATLEVVVPFWVRSAIRADLANRRNIGFQAVTDAEIRTHFAARKLNVQFIYDWQTISETALVYPTTFNAVMYPAGTFFKGTAPVINLSTVYDAASLAVNIFTALFTEQGYMIGKRKFHSDLVTLPVCNAGRVGAANLTCS